MMENKIKLNIISNRKLCENENLEKQIKKSQLQILKKSFAIGSLFL